MQVHIPATLLCCVNEVVLLLTSQLLWQRTKLKFCLILSGVFWCPLSPNTQGQLMQKMISCVEFHLLTSPYKTPVYTDLRDWSSNDTHLTSQPSPAIQQDIAVFISFACSSNPNTLQDGCVFPYVPLIIYFQLSCSLSLQFHLSYPPTGPAVTLKKHSTVTMVTHTAMLDLCCHHPHYHHCHRCWGWDCGTNAKNGVDPEPDRKMISRREAQWLKTMETRSLEKVRMCLCLCMWVCLVCSQEFFLLTTSIDRYTFFFSLLEVWAPACVFALGDLQKFSLSNSSFTLHCLPGRCYWQPEPEGIAELVRHIVQQVWCFQYWS